MKDKINEICYNLELGCINWTEASNKLLNLFNTDKLCDICKEQGIEHQICNDCRYDF